MIIPVYNLSWINRFFSKFFIYFLELIISHRIFYWIEIGSRLTVDLIRLFETVPNFDQNTKSNNNKINLIHVPNSHMQSAY